MGEVFYTSDLHLGHELVAGKRGFSSSAEHDTALALMWDLTVKHDDTVFVLGDLAISQFGSALAWVAARPGKKHFIPGNHDPVHPARSNYLSVLPRWLKVFETVQPYLQRKLDGVSILLSHFPYMSWGEGPEREGPARWEQFRLPELDTLLLHGHTHGREKAHGNSFHVGLDAHGGSLVPQQEILDWIESIHGPARRAREAHLDEFIETFNALPFTLEQRTRAYEQIVAAGHFPKGARYLGPPGHADGRMTRI